MTEYEMKRNMNMDKVEAGDKVEEKIEDDDGKEKYNDVRI